VTNDAKTAFNKTHKLKELDPKKAATKITNTEISRLEFITREILHALKLHDISNKMMEMVKAAVREALIKIADEDSNTVMDVMDLSRKMTAYMKTL
jgi:hypothetical protein